MKFKYMKELMDHLTSWRIPGNSAEIYKDGKQVFRYSSGYSDVENKILMSGDEYLYIYSCSKVATVTAALQLYEKGRFLLDDPLYEYIPEYREMYIGLENGDRVKAKNIITLRHLFTMTAGLTYNSDTEGFRRAYDESGGKMDTLIVARHIADDPLAFEPGTHWGYSLCHDVLAAVVEVISGKKFRDYVRENIFEPVGMSNSSFRASTEILEKMAQQYYYNNNPDSAALTKMQSEKQIAQGVVENVGKKNSHLRGSEYDSGGAGIITTVGDYALFGAALANRGLALSGERILSPGTVELLRTNQLNEVQLKDFNWRQLTGYGYGLGVRTTLDRAQAGYLGSGREFGWGGAAGATLIVDPDENVAMFYAHHMLNPHEEYYQPRIRNCMYTCLNY